MTQKEVPILIIGGGPAGIALAIECIELGCAKENLIILEKGEVPVKAICQFYPEKKMTLANYKSLPTETLGHLPCFPDMTKKETLDYYDELIQRYQLSYYLNSEVYKVIPHEKAFRVFFNHEEIFAQQVAIGIGILGRPNKPKYKLPVKLRQKILFDLTSQPVKNEKVLVVGGGDTSSEYCQILIEENCDLTLAVRSKRINRMMEHNLQAAENLQRNQRMRLLLGCEILELQDEGGQLKAVFKDSEKNPSEVFDKIIYAIGGTTPVNFLKTVGVEFDEKNWPKFDENGQTNIPGVFLVGDLVAGKMGGSIITAYNSAYRTAKRML